MKVNIIFDFPGVDPNSEEADNIIQCLEIDLNNTFDDDYNWWIDDAVVD